MLIILNGKVVDPETHFCEKADLEIVDDCIAGIYVHGMEERADRKNLPEDCDILDAKGRYVMPGFIDLHVHLRDPGQILKEDILTGSRAAAAGGVTTVCAMPNTSPPVDCTEILERVYRKADREAIVRIRQISAITRGMEGRELVDMEAMAKAGAVAFSEDGKSVMDVCLYREAMAKAAELNMPVFAHCEDKNLVGKGVFNEGIASRKYHVDGISNSVEDIIAARDIFLAGETGARLHLCHCSTRGSVELVRMAKRLGIAVTAEVCPHHFTLTDEDIAEPVTNYKMNPPLRSEADVRALLQGLSDGTMQVISTDHAPHLDMEKQKSLSEAPFGIIGLETSAALTYTALVKTGLISIIDMAEKMSHNPAKILGIDDQYGKIAVGAKADLAVFDADEEWEVNPAKFYSKANNTPYAGKVLQGRVKATIVGGRVVYKEKEVLADKER